MKKVLKYLFCVILILFFITLPVYANEILDYEYLKDYYIKEMIILLITNLLIEIPIFYFSFKDKRDKIIFMIIANLISYPIFFWMSKRITIYDYYSPYEYYRTIILLELAVIIFETIFIHFGLKKVKFLEIFYYSIVANTVSAIFGFVMSPIILTFYSSFLS